MPRPGRPSVALLYGATMAQPALQCSVCRERIAPVRMSYPARTIAARKTLSGSAYTAVFSPGSGIVARGTGEGEPDAS